MNKFDLEKRLKILVDEKVIEKRHQEITMDVFEKASTIINKNELDQAEMLFTHLPMSLKRIEKGEKIDGPKESIVKEIEDSQFYDNAMEQIKCIEKCWGEKLPIEEIRFLLLHFVILFSTNKGGN